MRVLGTLDRYVLRQWLATFLLATLGIPAVSILIRFADFYGRLADKGVPPRDIFLGFGLLYPSQLALLFPAGVLFATVFTLNAMGRHSELTAAKAGGVSFYRLAAPMLVLATIAVPINFALQEIAAVSTSRQRVLHKEKADPNDQIRYNFAFQEENGWSWAAKELQRGQGLLKTVLLESPPDSLGRRWTIAADSARWSDSLARWTLLGGAAHLISDSGTTTVAFREMRVPVLVQPPGALMDAWSRAEEMRTPELAAYLERLRRSGTRPGMLAVDLPLKYAVPVACLVIALFGAPLAVTTPRAGAALGLAIALGTTLIYLTGTQIMKSVGGRELVDPMVAAWSMNGVFLAVAVILMARVRS
jgi:lipopolysaccharide export system permease protein